VQPAGPPSHIAAVFAQIRARNPMHHRFVTEALARLSAEELDRLDQYIAFCRSRGLSDEDITDCYLTIVNDTLREQAYFRKHGRYRYSSFAEVAGSVYFDAGYMTKYMYGLAISSFLWPNHLDLFRFFEETLPTTRAGRYLEIGPGHGYFLMTAMRRSAFTDYMAVDISQTSIDQTRAIIAHFAPELAAKARLECADFLSCELPEAAFDAVVMGEVLEHVEEPSAFLAQIRRLAVADAHIYITTCINAPAVDHICLFESPEQLEGLFAESGLEIRRQLIRPYEGKTVAESMASKLPVNVAYVLARA
jgi:SAM-dependent methyltransferase